MKARDVAGAAVLVALCWLLFAQLILAAVRIVGVFTGVLT